MRITDTNPGKPQLLTGNSNWLVNQFVHTQSAGKSLWLEGSLAHGNRGGAGVAVLLEVEYDRDDATFRFDREDRALGLTGGVQVTGEDVQAVA